MGCMECIRKAAARRKELEQMLLELDRLTEEADKISLVAHEKKVVCKKESKGKYFICSLSKAVANNYTIM